MGSKGDFQAMFNGVANNIYYTEALLFATNDF